MTTRPSSPSAPRTRCGWTAAREGAGIEAIHALDAAGVWSVQVRAVYQERRFRLDDDGLRPEGIF